MLKWIFTVVHETLFDLISIANSLTEVRRKGNAKGVKKSPKITKKNFSCDIYRRKPAFSNDLNESISKLSVEDKRVSNKGKNPINTFQCKNDAYMVRLYTYESHTIAFALIDSFKA